MARGKARERKTERGEGQQGLVPPQFISTFRFRSGIPSLPFPVCVCVDAGAPNNNIQTARARGGGKDWAVCLVPLPCGTSYADQAAPHTHTLPFPLPSPLPLHPFSEQKVTTEPERGAARKRPTHPRPTGTDRAERHGLRR